MDLSNASFPMSSPIDTPMQSLSNWQNYNVFSIICYFVGSVKRPMNWIKNVHASNLFLNTFIKMLRFVSSLTSILMTLFIYNITKAICEYKHWYLLDLYYPWKVSLFIYNLNNYAILKCNYNIPTLCTPSYLEFAL